MESNSYAISDSITLIKQMYKTTFYQLIPLYPNKIPEKHFSHSFTAYMNKIKHVNKWKKWKNVSTKKSSAEQKLLIKTNFENLVSYELKLFQQLKEWTDNANTEV